LARRSGGGNGIGKQRESHGNDRGSPSQAVRVALGPIAQFALKTAIVAVAIVLSAWIMLDVLEGL
jgi:hypothetical protein